MDIDDNAYIEYRKKIYRYLREMKEKGLTSEKKHDTFILSLEEILYDKR